MHKSHTTLDPHTVLNNNQQLITLMARRTYTLANINGDLGSLNILVHMALRKHYRFELIKQYITLTF